MGHSLAITLLLSSINKPCTQHPTAVLPPSSQRTLAELLSLTLATSLRPTPTANPHTRSRPLVLL